MVEGSPLAASFFVGGALSIEEGGTVVEVRGRTALVRLRRSSACSGCASAGHCHAGGGESEQVLEASNEAGAAAGDAVRVAVSSRAVLGASVKIYLLPVAGLLAGAAVAQVLARSTLPPAAAENAAGVGGIIGALLAVLVGRRWGGRAGGGVAVLPRITRIVPAVDSPRPAD
jgi:sigma-E factor negative regulatory protein RseC